MLNFSSILAIIWLLLCCMIFDINNIYKIKLIIFDNINLINLQLL
jgi:hypothetical protein